MIWVSLGEMLLIWDGIFIWMSRRLKEDYFLKWKGYLVVKNSDAPPWVRRLQWNQKDTRLVQPPQDKKEGAVSNPQPSQFGFSWMHSLLRRVGSRGECWRSRQSIVVELTWLILPYATQDVMEYNLCETLLGMKILETVHNVAELHRFKADVIYGS